MTEPLVLSAGRRWALVLGLPFVLGAIGYGGLNFVALVGQDSYRLQPITAPISNKVSVGVGNGDITVMIPSNVGVTISAENQLADSIRRILSDFREIQPRLRGMRLEAEGPVNGGGPLLQISASSGTIFLKRTQ